MVMRLEPRGSATIWLERSSPSAIPVPSEDSSDDLDSDDDRDGAADDHDADLPGRSAVVAPGPSGRDGRSRSPPRPAGDGALACPLLAEQFASPARLLLHRRRMLFLMGSLFSGIRWWGAPRL